MLAPRRVYGRRSKPLGVARKAALAKLPDIEIRLDGVLPGTLEPQSLFPNLASHTAHLEIGFGTGEHLAELAQQHPHHIFLGAEPYIAGVSSLLKTIQAKEIKNIRLYPADGLALLAALAAGSLDHAYLLFPDPWPKKRHHGRRFIQPETVREFARVIRPGGTLLLASDHRDLAAWMTDHMQSSTAFSRLENPPPTLRTRYAHKALAVGKALHYIQFIRI